MTLLRSPDKLNRPAASRAVPAGRSLSQVTPILRWLLLVASSVCLCGAAPAAEVGTSDAAWSGPDAPVRVLPPRTNERIREALRRAGPGWRLPTGAVSAQRVEATVCHDASCVPVTLTDPTTACPGVTAGGWCVFWPEGAPPGVDALYEALAFDAPNEVWQTIAARSPPVAATPSEAKAPAADLAVAATAPAQQPPRDGQMAAAGGRLPSAPPFSSNLARWLLAVVAALAVSVLLAVRQTPRWTQRAGAALRHGNPGWLATLWLAPNVFLGFWLTVVPDEFAFGAKQLVLILHVALGIITLPVLLGFTWRHIFRAQQPLTGPGWNATLGKLGATGALVLSLGSGLVVLDSGQGMPAGTTHLIASITLLVLLVWHLRSLSLRKLLRPVLWAIGGAAALLGAGWLLALTEDEVPTAPPFAFVGRPTSLYDEAAWCGSCHQELYDEWQQSVHAGTLGGTDVRKEQMPLQDAGHFRFQLADVAGVIRGQKDPHQQMPVEYASCNHCHAPVQFYSDTSDIGPFGAAAPVSDGVTCSFCHTLRGVRDFGVPVEEVMPPGATKHDGNMDQTKALQIAPFYVSAPEKVRRYLGQNARDPVARWVGDRLINWWPALHRSDYHPAFLDTSAACQGCHGFGLDGNIHGTYDDWRQSSFAKAPPSQQATCQDCHMVRKMTGKRVQEPGRHVGWGPVRPQRALHWFAGGNANWSTQYATQQVLDFQRTWNQRSVEVEVTSTAWTPGKLEVSLLVRAPLVGHGFPSMETVLRYAWIELQVLDAQGRIVGRTRPATSGSFSPSVLSAGAPGADPPSVVLYRTNGYPYDGTEDTVIPAGGRRSFTVVLPLSAPDKPAEVAAQVYQSFDLFAIARTRAVVK